MATFNAEKVLPAAIASFQAQTWPDKELLVADGGSTDKTVSILQQHNAIVAWWTSSPDQGFADAWNRGIQHASGDWLYFMGADDEFCDPTTLELAAEQLAKIDQSQYIAYGNVELVRSDGMIGQRLGSAWNPSRFRQVCMSIPHQGTFHRRQLFEKYGLFETSDRKTPTYEMLLRYLKNNDAVYLKDLTVGRMGFGGMSTQPKNQLLFYKAYIKAQKKHGTYCFNAELFFRLFQGACKQAIYKYLGDQRASALVNFTRRLVGKEALG